MQNAYFLSLDIKHVNERDEEKIILCFREKDVGGEGEFHSTVKMTVDIPLKKGKWEDGEPMNA